MARNLLEIQDVALKVAVSTKVNRNCVPNWADPRMVLASDADPTQISHWLFVIPPNLRASVHAITMERKLIEERRGADV
jgi:hypothetical protein